MEYFKPYTLNLSGNLLEVDSPIVMGILNVTPDSFYSGSRCGDAEGKIRARVRQILAEGGRIIDIGGYSSRPMADDVTPEEEWRRLSLALKILREEAPEAIVSVDTFRATVAERCVGEYGVDIVNDISAGELDADMIATVARLKVPYVMMHMRGNPHTMQGLTDLLASLEVLQELGCPLLAGVSRKSMIYNLLGVSPEESLGGTIAVNTLALLKGASILRVHDVKEAVETVAIVEKFREQSPC